MKVVVHAGVAHSDDGRLLDLLKANTQVLGQWNVAYRGFSTYKNYFRTALDSFENRQSIQRAREEFLKQIPNYGNFDRLILSTPRFIGEIETAIMDGQFYPLAGQRIACLVEIFEGFEVELFIGLRNPGSFIPRALMSQPESQRQRILRQTDLSCLSWLAMIDNIRDLAPNVNFTVWSNEDTPLVWGDIARAMAGLPENAVLSEEYSLLSSLVSGTGKQEIQNLMQQKSAPCEPSLRSELSRIFDEYAMPDAIEEELDLEGWSDEIVSAFTELYEQDLAMLEAMPDIKFLRP
ncbi:hypothetical protein [Ruegeria arenilitoris]|uniref:hypothetical protein n=1 Tax=Ruegeria arenilitoris TaxID=1173585 RepID=UPI001480E90F|nr:hypothetical protein [Ruegeria arenilitoris]